MKISTKYGLLQSLYWMQISVAWGYCTSYYLEYGYSTQAIGIFTAVFCLLATALQPMIGRYLDRSIRHNWKIPFFILGGSMELLLVLLFFLRTTVTAGLFFGLYYMLISTMLTLVNYSGFYYVNRGENLNFGVARGLGSLAYAIMAVFLGRLIALFDIHVILVVGAVINGLLLGVVATFPILQGEEMSEKQEEKKKSSTSLLQKYPAFFVMALACLLVTTFHNMYTNYMLLIMEGVGGDNGSLGNALAIAAVAELPVMFLANWLLKRWKASTFLTIACVGHVVRGVLYLKATSVWMIYGIQCLQMVAFALVVSMSVYYANESMDDADKGAGQSMMSMVITGALVAGNLIGGFFITHYGIRAMLLAGICLSALGFVLACISVSMQKRFIYAKNE